MSRRGRPDVILTRPENRSEYVVQTIGDLKPGSTVQVEVAYKGYMDDLLCSLRTAYPETVFTAQDFHTGGVRYAYIYIEKHKRKIA